MTLTEFCNNKPPELRLGQYFFNEYLYLLHPQDKMHATTQKMYNTEDVTLAVHIIKDIMDAYQWEELPE